MEQTRVVGQFEMRYDIVLIEWLDSKGITNQWEYLDETEPLLPDNCLSVGYLIDDNAEYKTIVQCIGKTQVIGRTTIPCFSIRSIKKMGLI